jgi:hypothetical protein
MFFSKNHKDKSMIKKNINTIIKNDSNKTRKKGKNYEDEKEKKSRRKRVVYRLTTP